MVLIHDMHVLWLRVSSVGMILVAGDRFLLGIGLEPKVADFWNIQNFDPRLGRPPKNQGESVQTTGHENPSETLN